VGSGNVKWAIYYDSGLLDQAPPDKGAQDGTAQSSLHLGPGSGKTKHICGPVTRKIFNKYLAPPGVG